MAIDMCCLFTLMLYFLYRRQLFVLPAPSSTPFVHVIPYFTGMLNLSQRALTLPETHKDEVLDPAEVVLRQKKAGNNPKRQQQQLGAKGRDKEKTRGSQREQREQQQANSFGIPSLDEMYSAIVQAKDQSLAEPNSRMDLDNPLTLTSIYMDYTGPLLRQFLDGWIKATTVPGGYGSIVGKRSVGHLEVRRHNMLRNCFFSPTPLEHWEVWKKSLGISSDNEFAYANRGANGELSKPHLESSLLNNLTCVPSSSTSRFQRCSNG